MHTFTEDELIYPEYNSDYLDAILDDTRMHDTTLMSLIIIFGDGNFVVKLQNVKFNRILIMFPLNEPFFESKIIYIILY